MLWRHGQIPAPCLQGACRTSGLTHISFCSKALTEKRHFQTTYLGLENHENNLRKQNMSIILESLLVEKWRFPGVSFLSEAICTSFLNFKSTISGASLVQPHSLGCYQMLVLESTLRVKVNWLRKRKLREDAVGELPMRLS